MNNPNALIIIGLDIDSTVVTHKYPAMGEDLGAIPWLKQILSTYPQTRILLNTMRDGKDLIRAKEWLEERGIPVWAMNQHPTQKEWTQSPKPYAHIYIDDRNVGTPLRKDRCIDWNLFGPLLIQWVEDYVKFN